MFAPSPFFVKKMANDDMLRDMPITFVVADDNIRDIFIRHFNEIRYSGGKGNYFTFLSFDDYFYEPVKEEGRHSLEEIVLVAEGIHNSTEPKRKVFWKYGANSCNDIKITKMTFINTKNKIQRMMPVENGNKVLSKDALMDAVGFAFFAVAVALWLYLLIVRKKPYNPLAKSEKIKATAGIGELMGNVCYIFAMALNTKEE